MSQECPNCGLFSPDIAERCDCGFDFLTLRIAPSYARPTDPEIRAEQGMTVAEAGFRRIENGLTAVIGHLIPGIALIIAIDLATGGRLQFHWWGPIAIGLATAFRGVAQYRRGKRG
jgi:hypothetical protein